jgi:hypothetical protein
MRRLAVFLMVLIVFQSCVAVESEPMHKKIEALTQCIDVMWKEGNCEAITVALEDFESHNGTSPGLLLLKMSNALACKRDMPEYQKLKGEFDRLISSRDSASDIKAFLQETSALGSWAQATTNDTSYKTFVRVNRDVIPHVVFPEREVAIWVQSIWDAGEK